MVLGADPGQTKVEGQLLFITTLLASVDTLYYHPSCQCRNNTPYEEQVQNLDLNPEVQS